MSSLASIAEITSFATARQVAEEKRKSWFDHWLESRRQKAAARRLAEQLSMMSEHELRDIDIDPASLAGATVRLAQCNPAVVAFTLVTKSGRS